MLTASIVSGSQANANSPTSNRRRVSSRQACAGRLAGVCSAVAKHTPSAEPSRERIRPAVEPSRTEQENWKKDALTTFVVQCSRSGSGLVPAPVIKAHLNGLRRVHGLFYRSFCAARSLFRSPRRICFVCCASGLSPLRSLPPPVSSSLSIGSPLSPARSSSAGAPTLLPGFAVRW